MGCELSCHLHQISKLEELTNRSTVGKQILLRQHQPHATCKSPITPKAACMLLTVIPGAKLAEAFCDSPLATALENRLHDAMLHWHAKFPLKGRAFHFCLSSSTQAQSRGISSKNNFLTEWHAHAEPKEMHHSLLPNQGYGGAIRPLPGSQSTRF